MIFFLQAYFVGDTGVVRIDRYGDRSNIELDLHKIDAGGHQLLGTWSSTNGLLSIDDGHSNQKNGLANHAEPLVITTVLVTTLLFMISITPPWKSLYVFLSGYVEKILCGSI